MPPRLALQLLGPPRLTRGGRPVEFARRKALALLAYLAVEGRPQSREALAALFWPDHDQARARANLRTCLSSLARTLKCGALAVEGETIRLAPGAMEIDAEGFGGLSRPCPAHGPGEACDRCLPRLQEAAALYRGDLLAGFTLAECIDFDQWQASRGQRLRQELASVLRRLARGCGARGRFEEAIGAAQRLVALDPLEEASHRELMRLYAAAGERAAALRQYRECCRILREELGAEPQEETRALYAEIGGGAARGSPRLPVPPGALLGRENELARARELLRERGVRLLTLTGAGGVGKTRLALQIAAELGTEYADGAFFVDLAPLREPAQVAPAVARAIGLREPAREGSALVEPLRDFLAERQVLLVLDNFEHLVEAGPLAANVVAACPRVTVLATSRQPLRVRGETELRVEPLALPRPGDAVEQVRQAPAVQLLVARALDARAELAVTAHNAALVAEVCVRLDGLPLAVELAAPHLRVLSLRDLHERLGSPLTLLRRGARDLAPRQQALRATLDWTYGLLEAEAKQALAGVSVFDGSFALEAAEAICPDGQAGGVLDELESLVDKSLLRQDAGCGETRFRLLETVREYAAERLDERGDEAAIRERHARFFLGLAEAAARELHGPDQVAWLARLDRDHANLLASVRWFVANGRVEEALREVAALEWFWFTRGHSLDGKKCALDALTAAGGDVSAALRAGALSSLSSMVFLTGDWSRSAALAEESLRLFRAAGDDRGTAIALTRLGVAERFQGDDARGTPHCEQAVRIARACGDEALLVRALIRAYATAGGKFAGEPPRAQLDETVEIARRIGDLWGVAHGLNGLGDLLRETGQTAEARARYQESLELFRQLDNRWMIAWTLEGLGTTCSLDGDHAAAREHLAAAIRLFHDLGDRGNTVFMLRRLGMAARAAGDHLRAATLLGAFGRLEPAREPAPADVEAALAEYAACQPRAFARGQAMSVADAVDYAVAAA